MSRRNGFTLLEVCLVIFIIMILAAVAVPSIQGLFAEQKLRRSFESFDDFVHGVQARAVAERRAFVLIWDGKGITVQPDEPVLEDSGGDGDYYPFGEGKITLERPAALEKNPPVEWLFWRSGTCEPAIIRFEGEAGSWTVRYDPLTVQGEFLEKEIR